MLLLLHSNQSALKVFHNLKEIFKTERIGLYFHLVNQLDCLIRFTTDFWQNSFDGFQVDIARFVLVKDVENSSEIFNFFLSVDLKDVKLSI